MTSLFLYLRFSLILFAFSIWNILLYDDFLLESKHVLLSLILFFRLTFFLVLQAFHWPWKKAGHLTINKLISQNMPSKISPSCINIYAYVLESFQVNISIMNKCSKPWMICKIQPRYRLLFSGDIETNSGSFFETPNQHFPKQHKRIKIIHIKRKTFWKNDKKLEPGPGSNHISKILMSNSCGVWIQSVLKRSVWTKVHLARNAVEMWC